MIAFRNIFVVLAVAGAVIVPLYFAGAALGTKYEYWGWQFGLLTLTVKFGAVLLLGVAGFAVVAIIFSFLTPNWSYRWAAIAALLVPLAGLGLAAQIASSAQSVPPIHDISTDLDDPPLFSRQIMLLRGDGSNPVTPPREAFGDDGPVPSLHGKIRADLQTANYPDIHTITIKAPPEKALRVSADVLAIMNMDVYPAANDQVEATATSFWFGFKDDVVVRVRPAPEGGALVDVRSVSRVGVSDMGANAERIRTFRDKFLSVID